MRKGFTLIELLIVIAIIGLLATLAVVTLNSAQQKARDTKRIADVKQISGAMEIYYNENSSVYPAATTWTALGTALSPYISNMPADPENDADYYYVVGTNYDGSLPSSSTSYTVGTRLEDTAHAALDGDVDTNDTTGPTFMTSSAVGLTQDSQGCGVNGSACAANSPDQVLCVDATPGGAYCLSN